MEIRRPEPLTKEKIMENVKYLKKIGKPKTFIDDYLSQENLPIEYQEKIDSFNRFEQTPMGKFLIKSNKVAGFLPELLGFPATIKPQDTIRKRFSDEMQGKNLMVEALKDIAAEGGKTGIAAAQLIMSNIGAPATAAKGLQGAKQVLSYGAKQAAIQGALGAGKKELEGSEAEDSLKGGLFEGGLNMAAIVGLPAFGKLIKTAGNSLIKASSNVRNFAIDHAMKNPRVLIEPQKSVVTVGEEMVDTLSGFADKVKSEFQNKIDKIEVPEGLIIDTSKISELAKGKRLDMTTLSSKLKNQRTNNLLDLSDEAIDRFVSGGGLDFEEARTINSLLFDIVDTGISQDLGSGGIGKIGSIKKTFLNLMDEQVPGIRDANKYYAENTKFYQDTLKDISKRTGDLKEGALNIMGQRKTGLGTAGRTKSQEIARLEKLDSLMGTNHIGELTDGLVAEEFEKIGMSNLMETIRFGGSASLGAVIGSQVAGVPGAITGAALTSGASGMLRDPNTTKKIILGSQKIKKSVPSKLIEGISSITKPLRTGFIAGQTRKENQNER